MTTVCFRVDRETYEVLKRKASEEGMTLSDLMRYMVRQFIGKPIRNELEKRLEELERRVQELEKLIKQQSGIGLYLRRR